MKLPVKTKGPPIPKAQKEGQVSELRSVTLADVARHAGVSQITASRVVRNRGPIAEETRARVLASVEALGYVQNRIAGTLAGAQSDLVGVVVPSLTNIVFTDVLRGLNEALVDSHLKPIVTVSEYSQEAEERIVSSLLTMRPGAMILAGLEHSDATREKIRRSGTFPVEIMDFDGEAMDSVVGMSHDDAARKSAEFLLRRGYRRFGYVGQSGQDKDLRAARRRDEFIRTIVAAGARFVGEEIMSEPSSVPLGRRATKRLLDTNPKIDAIYFSNDDMAIGGAYHCQAEGLDVPGRVALFGFNGLDIGQAMPRPLSTVLTYRYDIGLQTGRTILARLEGRREGGTRINVGYELITGSTA